MRRSVDFNTRQAQTDSGYDLLYDLPLIEASFASQYGIRLAQEQNMTWREFAVLLSGLMGETPLGKVVRVRTERNADALRKMNLAERQMRAAWQRFRKTQKKTTVPYMNTARLQAALAACFGKEKR